MSRPRKKPNKPTHRFVRSVSAAQLRRALGLHTGDDLVMDDAMFGVVRVVTLRVIRPVADGRKQGG